MGRGVYEILSLWRRGRAVQQEKAGQQGRARAGGEPPPASAPRVGETVRAYGRRHGGSPADTVHAVVTRDRDWYTVECLELAVVAQGRTLDELVANLNEAVMLHLEGEEPAHIGVVAEPRISLTYEVKARSG